MNVSASEQITLFCFSHTFVILSAVDFDICCICLKLLISEHMHSRDDRAQRWRDAGIKLGYIRQWCRAQPLSH